MSTPTLNDHAETHGIVLPSSPSDLKRLKGMLQEGVDAEYRLASERDKKKAILQQIKEEFQLPPKVSGKLVKTMYKSNYSEVAAEMDDFQIAYEKITGA